MTVEIGMGRSGGRSFGTSFSEVKVGVRPGIKIPEPVVILFPRWFVQLRPNGEGE